MSFLDIFSEKSDIVHAMNAKAGLHPRNKHKNGYDFELLVKKHPALKPFVKLNPRNEKSIDFSDAAAVMALNTALLKAHYNIADYSMPEGYLCPPVPGRADYIHHIADLLKTDKGELPVGKRFSMLDIGVGANCIYPLIAHAEYEWTVVGSDIDTVAIENAESIVSANKLDSAITLRLQENKNKILDGIIRPEDFFHFVVCNPPFHSSSEEAAKATLKKNFKLGLAKYNQNFGGTNNELWCEGGEQVFITRMINESLNYRKNVHWFTCLVSRYETLPSLYAEFKRLNIKSVRTLDMSQGQKKSRILAWTLF